MSPTSYHCSTPRYVLTIRFQRRLVNHAATDFNASNGMQRHERNSQTKKSEPVSVNDLRPRHAVQPGEAVAHRIIQPVVDVDKIEIVPGFCDPSKPRLPAEHGALRVVLHVVDNRDPGIELRFDDNAIQTREKPSFGERYAIPLV